jgi:hypothetical protein
MSNNPFSRRHEATDQSHLTRAHVAKDIHDAASSHSPILKDPLRVPSPWSAPSWSQRLSSPEDQYSRIRCM